MKSYNADVAHCIGYKCPLAYKCRRFSLFCVYRAMNPNDRPMLVSFISSMYKNRKCDNFLSNAKQNKSNVPKV